MIKIQRIVDVEEKMYYEFGIFSTIYERDEMPNWFRHKSSGSSISFIIPSSSNKLTGLNFCSVDTFKPILKLVPFPDDLFPPTPMITISNVTKNHMWIYERRPDKPGGKRRVLLSHWMFGMNELEAGDHVTVTATLPSGQLTEECGVSLVYDDGVMDDALDYYKSLNHIIGGDLSPFQTTTGQYILSKWRFSKDEIRLYPYHRKFIPDGPQVQVKEFRWFRALSQRKLDVM